MLRRKARTLSLLLALFAIGVSALVLSTDRADVEEYRQLRENAEGTGEHSAPTSAHQTREGIWKHIWLSRDGKRLQIQLHGERSKLELEKGDLKKIHIMESMEGVTCWIQEELLYRLPDGREAKPLAGGRWSVGDETLPTRPEELIPFQQVRYLVADKAKYYYDQNRLLAESVDLYRYEMEGHELPDTPHGRLMMQGAAHSCELTVLEEDVDFSANRLTATFFNRGGF